MFLDQFTQPGEGRVPGGGGSRPARPGPWRLEPGGEDQHLQVGEHHVAERQVAAVLLPPEPLKQVRDFCRTVAERDHGDAVGVVEQDAATADLGVERLDAQEVGVELDDLPLNGAVGDEPDVLVGDEEQKSRDRMRTSRRPPRPPRSRTR